MSYYYFDHESEMALINNFQNWKKEDKGEADALWRTGVAYIATSDQKYKNGILRAFRKYKKNGKIKVQACRCNPMIRENDVSRDQLVMAWSALYLNGDHVELNDIIKHTPFRISKRFIMTPTMWLWSRGLVGKTFLGHLGQLFLSIELIINVFWNKLIKLLIGYNEYTIPELSELLTERGESIRDDVLTNKWKKFLWSMNFPGYGLHLAAWVTYTSKDSIFKRINNKLIQIDMAKENYLLSKLTGLPVGETDIDRYDPHEEWIWSQRMTKMNRNRRIPISLVDDECLDKLILTSKLLK